ncbi:hypothetical protein [Hymenobacter rubidus]|uniref:hypothetical protein n=1 Tax=Hymenobacter rubidus TaxID=1441626 RepID=UPI00191CC6EF|nr:hypothetical protein [Hymenobacter rubidus]
MKRPILLTKKALTKPIELTLERIESIRQRKVDNTDKIILEGLFVLAMASFEHSLNDTLKVLLTHIPEKLDIKTEPISKDELIYGNPLERAIDNKVTSIGYKNLSDIIKYFIKIVDIPENIISEDELDSLLEIKATRNLLIHNNLVVNNIYKETAGVKIRNPHSQGRLLIDQSYLFNSLVVLRQVLENIKTELELKYIAFTKIKAIKSLFEYIFKTPVLVFEDEFSIVGDEIGGFKSQSSSIESLSTSERLFYDIWLAHSDGREFEFPRHIIYHLDNANIDKIKYFISALDLLKS